MFSWPALFAAGCASQPTADLRRIPGQNVLLVTIDTLRADALGCYGGPAATPALDRLAADGVRFDFAHAHAVTTLTSHASILTGTYPFQHGIRDNSGYRLAAETRTVATRLTRAGYATAAFVGGFPVHSRFGLNQGFDVYDDQFGDTRAPDEFTVPERPASTVVPLARQWIAEHTAGGAAQSWFAWVHVFDPHAPYRPPPPFDTRYASQPYYGEVAAVDAALAPLLDDLLTASTPALVIVTGDHGEALGDHGEQSHGLFTYEPTLRVPLIIAEVRGTQSSRSPQRSGNDSFFARFAAFAFRHTSARGGEVSSVSARHVDILPTILDAVGLEVPADLVGRTLLRVADGAERLSPRPSYFEAMSATLNRGWAPLTGVIVGREKYIALPIAERYDLAADSAERTNLVGRSLERDRALAAALRGFNTTTPGPRRMEDAEAAARLRALGYLSGSAPLKAGYAEADDPKQLVDLDRGIHDAVEAFTAGRAAEAVRIYQHVIARRPDMALAYRHLAFIDWQRGDAAGAIDTLRHAMKSGVADPRLMGQLGGYLAEAGHIAEGIRFLEPAANEANTDLDSLNALGIAYAQTGRADAARAIFARVLTINPRSSVPLENLGLLALERGDVIEARRRFESAVQVDPRSSRAQAGLGNVALKVGDRAGAIEAWTRAVQLDPRNFDALYNVGTALAHGGQMGAARPYLDRFLETAPPAFYAKDLKEVAALVRR